MADLFITVAAKVFSGLGQSDQMQGARGRQTFCGSVGGRFWAQGFRTQG
jgi:hypothetical protein